MDISPTTERERFRHYLDIHVHLRSIVILFSIVSGLEIYTSIFYIFVLFLSRFDRLRIAHVVRDFRNPPSLPSLRRIPGD